MEAPTNTLGNQTAAPEPATQAPIIDLPPTEPGLEAPPPPESPTPAPPVEPVATDPPASQVPARRGRGRPKKLPPIPHHPLEEKYFLKARKDMGAHLPQKGREWDKLKYRCFRDLGYWLDKPILANVMKCDLLEHLESLKETLRWCQHVLSDTDYTKFPSEIRLEAANMINLTTKEFRELSSHLMELAKETEENRGNGRPRLNLPPQTNVLVSVNGGPPQAAGMSGASSGNGSPRALPPV